MKILAIISLIVAFGHSISAQVVVTVVIDKNHLKQVVLNGTTRNVAQMLYTKEQAKIKELTDKIGINTASLVLVNQMIMNSLTNVNDGLKSGIRVQNMAAQVGQIVTITAQIQGIANENPVYLLFAEKYIKSVKDRSFALALDVSGTILKESDDLLMNTNKRDEFIKEISDELTIITATLMVVKQTMAAAAKEGLLKSLNPFQDFVNQDITLVNGILGKTQALK